MVGEWGTPVIEATINIFKKEKLSPRSCLKFYNWLKLNATSSNYATY